MGDNYCGPEDDLAPQQSTNPSASFETEQYGVKGSASTNDPALGTQGKFGAGRWTDEDGVTNYGAAGDFAAVKYGSKLDKSGWGWDASALSAGANATHNKNTTGIGVGANALEASVTHGDAQENQRFGLSAGAGAGARVHHGDADGDGVPELGMGFDLGPISADIKSETLGECWNMLNDPEVDLPGPFW